MRIATMALALAGALALGGGDTKADTLPGMAGHGWPNHFDTCFGSSWQSMQNNCGVTRLLIIPAQGVRPGYSSVLVRASGNGASGMTNCQGISTFAGGGGVFADDFTQIVSTNTASTFQVLNLGNLLMFPASVIHFECFVAPSGGRVATIDFE
jgi:hypothetical protein